MLAVEIGCLAVIACFGWAWRARLRDATFRRELAVIAVAAWAAEDTCIRVYGFYEYHAPWRIFVGRVPLLVAAIWPLVIVSARSIARALRPDAGEARLALVTAVLVLADAAFIEPIAVKAGLWRWTRPGPFEVPVVGLLGWAFFAGAIVRLLARRRGPVAILAIVLAPLATHVLLLAAWWGAFRRLEEPASVLVAVALAAIAFATSVGGPIAWRELRRDLPVRVPAAAFFAWLLVRGGPTPALLAWSAACAIAWSAFAAAVFTVGSRPGKAQRDPAVIGGEERGADPGDRDAVASGDSAAHPPLVEDELQGGGDHQHGVRPA